MQDHQAERPTTRSTERSFYRKRHRLSNDRDYQAVYDAKIRKAHGPILVFIKPNNLPEHRLGLSVGRRVGNAVARGRVKRLIREAFRHERHALPTPETTSDSTAGSAGGSAPASYDIIVVARPHTLMPLPAYRATLADLVNRAHREWTKRAARGKPPADSTPDDPA